MKTIRIILILVLFQSQLIAQNNSRSTLMAGKIDTAVRIDGVLDDAIWINADSASEFWTNFPADTMRANSQTVVKIVYDDEYLYVAASMLNASPVRSYVASSLRRDYPFIANDAFGVILDTYQDQTNGYGFYVSAYGVQREEQIFSGTMSDGTWDTKWISAVSYDSAGWSAEMQIPLKYLRYRDDLDTWNINFVRNDIASNQRSSWIPVPRNFPTVSMAYHGVLKWTGDLKKVRKNFSIIPSLTYSANQGEDDKIATKARVSLDAKVSVSSALNMDITVNPDFSQAEVDQVQLNITRFELVFPEKRLFFIENSDLFSEFGITKTGTSPIRPFYSRRIGLKFNPGLQQYERTQLLGGVRLSGKVNKNLRLGLMSVQTAELETRSATGEITGREPGENYSVLALQQKVFARSNIGLIVENRQGMQLDSIDGFKFNKNNFNRVAGIEYNLASADNSWTGKVFTNYSISSNNKVENAHGFIINHNTLRSESYVGYTKASKDFNPDMGFVPRKNFANFYGEGDYKIYSKAAKSVFNFIAPIAHFDIFLDSAGRRTDHQLRYGLYLNFKNTSYMYILGWNEYTRLTFPFNPSQDEGPMLQPGSVHKYSAASIYYETDSRKERFGSLWVKTGQYFNGNFVQATVIANQKIQPWGTIGINIDYNRVALPKPYSTNTLYAIGPKADISFSRSLFFNTIIQYNSQNRNLNLYARLQWRFRPLSDLYIIFTNNHQANPWLRRDQALTAKLVFWL